MIQKKAALPPLGLATVAAMLPASWEKKLVDMSIQPLKDNDILWADYVFISGMVVQRKSAKEVIKRVKSCVTLSRVEGYKLLIIFFTLFRMTSFGFGVT